MTTLIAWVSYTKTGSDPDTPRALYLASDSRITWESSAHRWDAGRKVFAALRKPHIFGYCGDVVFPALALGQIVDALNLGVFDEYDRDPEELARAIYESIRTSFGRRNNAPVDDFWIAHAYRQGLGANSRFVVAVLSYHVKADQWDLDVRDVPDETGIVLELGTGAKVAEAHRDAWSASSVGGTSRAIFGAFSDAVKSGGDSLTGGAPQVAALFNERGGVSIGFVEDKRLYLHGLEVKHADTSRSLEWRDALFQRIDPKTLKPVKGARRFARPKRLRS